MNTHSFIGIETATGVRAVYCHQEGYLDTLGQKLLDSYDTPDKIHALLDCGGILSLNDTITNSQFFKDQNGGHGAKPYAEEFETWGAYFKAATWAEAERVYIYSLSRKEWLVSTPSTYPAFRSVRDILGS